MKFALVISEVNYMPQNYQNLYQEIFKANQEHLKAIVIIQNSSFKLLLQSLTLIFLGAPRLGGQLLINLIKNFTGINKKKLKKLGPDLIYCQSINQNSVQNKLKEYSLDIILNLRTRNIFKKETIKIPTLGCFNLHHGILPRDRGTFCDLWSIYEGNKSGATLHQMAEKIDQGPIVSWALVPANKNYREYLKSTICFEAQLINQFLTEIKQNKKLPPLLANRAQDIRWFKNPKARDLFKMKQQGMKL